MASRFVLTAQVQLQAPTNARQVVNQIQQQLRGVNMQVNLQGGQQAARQVNNLSNATQQATTAANRMGKAFGASIRRFGAFTIATRAVSLFTNSLANATKEAIDFEREMIKISQVTGKTMAQLKGLENTITDLSTSLGVSSKSILSVGRILSQAGIQAQDLEVALKTLAKTELAPTFDDITKTAEGAVAILAQFGEGVGALERQLGAINAVAGQFAVESGDLISVVRRTGGVFKAAGGELEELLALFTSVRATTRESAESIATGLRTIFTRIQRPETIEFLKQFGVELTDLNGKFVGPYDAIRQLSSALSGLQEGDIRFVQIAEELGGFRQIGKVIPLLQQFETAERARQAALEGGDSLNKDAAKAQAALAVQIAKVKEEFLALIRSLTQTTSFQTMVKTSLELASALIKVAEALKPVIPLLAAFGAIKFARGAAGFARGIGAGLRGGSPTGFARGGMVPGTGNRDTVPAMLTPGEFVIRKSSVSKLGAGTLAAMNENKFNIGGRITGATSQIKTISKRAKAGKGKKEDFAGAGQLQFDVVPGQVGAFVLNPPKGSEGSYKQTKDQPFILPPNNRLARLAAKQAGLSDKDIRGGVRAVLKAPAEYPVFYPGAAEGKAGMKRNAEYANAVSKGFDTGITKAIESTINTVKSSKLLDLPPAIDTNENALKSVIGQIKGDMQVKSSIEGYIFEGMISALSGAVAAGGRANFDFPQSAISQNKKKLGTLFGSPGLIQALKKAEAKRSVGEVQGNIQRKLANDIAAGFISGAKIRATGRGAGRKKLASGGGISGSDTVPAMLTPGEFVFNKQAAKSIGYSNLSRMNKHGVQGFNKGGPVGVQHFAVGGVAQGATSPGAVGNLSSRAANLAAAYDKQKALIDQGGTRIGQLTQTLTLLNQEEKKGSDVTRSRTALLEQLKAEESKYLAGNKKLTKIEELQYKTDERLIKAKQNQEAKIKSLSSVRQSLVNEQRYTQTKINNPANSATAQNASIKHFNDLEREIRKVDKELEKAGASVRRHTAATDKDTVAEEKSAATTAQASAKSKSQPFAAASAPATPFKGISAPTTQPFAAASAPATPFKGAGGPVQPLVKQSAIPSAAQRDPATQQRVAAINQEVKATNANVRSKTLLEKIEQRYRVNVKLADRSIQRVFDTGLRGNFEKLKGGFSKFAASMKSTDGSTKSLRGSLANLAKSAASAGAGLLNLKKSPILNSMGMGGAAPTGSIKDRLKSGLKAKEGGGSGAGMGIAMAGMMFASMIPQVEGATKGFGAMQNELGGTITMLTTFGFLLSGLGVPMNNFTMAIGAAVMATFAVTKMMDAYTGVHEKAKKAVEEGDVEGAGAAAVKSKNATVANAAAMGMAGIGAALGAAVGTIFGPAGTAFGAVLGGIAGTIAGVITKIILTMEALQPALNWFRDNILTLFGADSTAMVEARARMDAAAAREAKKLAEASKSASEELKKVKSGEKTIAEAFQSGNLTKGFEAVSEANKERERFNQDLTKEEVGKAGSAGLTATLLGSALKGAASSATLGTLTIAEAAGADIPSAGELGDELGSYIGLWDSASVRTSKALKEATEREKKAREENNKKLAEQLQSADFQEGFSSLARSITNSAAAQGGTFKGMDGKAILEQVLKGMGPEAEAQVRAALAVNPEIAQQFETQVKNMAKAAEENAAFLKSLNFGLKDVVSGISTFNNSLDNIAISSQTGFNSLAVATNTLSAVVAGAGATISAADLDSSLSTISSSFAAFGATADQIDGITGTVRGFNDAQKNANSALDSLRANLAGVDLQDSANLSSVKDNFKTALLNTIPDDSPIKDRLTSAFNGIGDLTKDEIEQFYSTGDASPILEKAFGPIGEQIEKQIIGPSKQMAEANSKLIKATEERRKAELQLIEVQKKAIDVQIEAAKNLEFFGGEKFTPEKEFAARRNQANLSLQDAGVAGLTTGSAADIRRAAGDVFSRFSTQQGAQNAAIEGSGGTAGAFADRRGIDTDRRPELQKANEALLEITKRGIEQRKQELDLIQKKNKAEKDALDSLLGGNIEEFFEKSSAAAAGSALRSGNAAAASLFSASSLGKGLQGLQGTGLSDAENKRAAQLTFGAMGLGDRAAQIYTGTTAEEERIKAEGRELSQLQSDLGDQMSAMESMNVEAKQVIINTQDAKFREMQNTVAQNQAALGLHRGGAVYANRGIFVPRGTDTVPAMLTPGEFVVNRAAVQRGNNLQILRAMNGGMGVGATNSAGTPTMNRGGLFGRREAPSFQMPDLSPVFDKFSEAVDKLAGLNISVKLDTTNVNVNFNGTSFLSTLDEKIRSAVLQEVSNQTGKLGMNESGDIKSNSGSVLGS